MKKTLIITDLDGTLLDSASYAFDEALPAIRHTQTHNIPLILCSSKTRAEIEVCRKQLGNGHPFIAENGGGIFVPHGYFAAPVAGEETDGYRVIVLGMPYRDVRERFVELRERLGVAVRGFGDMTVKEVAGLTGLTHEGAELAMQREFDEPFVFDEELDERFLQEIEAAGLRWTQGRIFHIMGHHHKGRAIGLLKELYQRQYGAVHSIGLGDSLNDLPMLTAVDQPVLVRHEDGSYDRRIELPYLMKTRLPGPAGWNEIVLQLLTGNPAGHVSPEATRQKDLTEIFNAALAAVDPYAAVLNALRLEQSALHAAGASYPLDAFERILVIGAGKSAARMALAAEQLLGDRISAGLVVTKYGHTLDPGVVRQLEAAHPVPDAAGMEATRQLLQLVREADERTLVICLLSGGASALLVAPAAGLTLADKQQATGLLLKAGASINELNAVRKHLSAVKGGRLAQAVYPARLLTLILSDVIGDRLDVIASGPTAADDSSYADALAVIDKYALQQKMPPAVMQYLQRGRQGEVAETVKRGDPCLSATHNAVIGGLNQALSAAADRARELGYATEIIGGELQGEAREAAHLLAQRAQAALASMQPDERHCLVSGGETTVTVTGPGRGGRNQELALAFALEMDGHSGVSLLSAGTDGSDGPTDAAGAVVNGGTAAQARRLGIDPEKHLNDNDSYAFFSQLDALAGSASHFITGPTGTNVMDVQLLLLQGTYTGGPS